MTTKDDVSESALRLLTDIEEKEIKDFLTNKSARTKLEWYFYARYYLRAAEVLLVAAEEKKEKEDKGLIITSLFNLRHSLELVLKATHMFIDSDPEEKIDNVHDIKRLFSSLKRKITPNSARAAKKLAEEIKIPEKKSEEYLKDQLEQLSNMVVKYYYQIPLGGVLEKGSYYIEDIDNELFRYPEAKKVKISIFSQNIISKLTQEDLSRIKRDIKKIKTALSILFLALGAIL